MKVTTVVLLGIFFLLGGLLGLWLSESFPATPQFQAAATFDQPLYLQQNTPTTKVMPKDRISEEQIKVYPDKIVIDLAGAEWATFADTGSMEPTLFQGANALQIIPQSPDDIQVGDIISYKPSYRKDITLIHRVVAKEGEGENTLFYAQGDANPFQDPQPVLFQDIERLTFAVVY